MNQTNISEFWTSSDGITAKFTWISDANLSNYTPYFQVRGICFDHQGRILIINEGSGWTIPGGTPEIGESAEETLRRELIEEADVELSLCLPLGVQKVDVENNPNLKEGDRSYQYRFIGLVDKIAPQTPDPDNGRVHERKFVPALEITDWVKWGKTGAAMFAEAIQAYLEIIV